MRRSHSTVRSMLVAGGLMLAAAAALSANGQEFFPAGKGPVDLVYFGIIKDAKTGRVVKDHAYITIKDRLTGISIPFTGDVPGHYRSPDVGAAIKELGEVADPQQLELSLVVPGYQKVDITKMPRKTAGAIELSFKLQPEGAAPQGGVAATTTSPASGTRENSGLSGQSLAMGLFIAAIALSAIAGVARTLVPRTSTTH